LFPFTLHPIGRQEEFTDQLARMSQSEAIFLLTTFANIATSRDGKDWDLIEAITTEVYKVWKNHFIIGAVSSTLWNCDAGVILIEVVSCTFYIDVH